MRRLTIIGLLVVAGCATDFSLSGGDTDTAVDTQEDTAADTAPDTAVDPVEDTTPVDTGTDVHVDPDHDTATDVPWDTPVDTAVDAVVDAVTDPTVDPVVDTWIDPYTDPTTDGGPCTSLTSDLGGECNVVAMCGCAAADFCGYQFDSTSCTAWEVCIPVASTLPGIGEPCDYTVLNSCAPGLACIYDGTTGLCFKWCSADTDCPAPLACSVDLVTGTCGSGIFRHLICY